MAEPVKFEALIKWGMAGDGGLVADVVSPAPSNGRDLHEDALADTILQMAGLARALYFASLHLKACTEAERAALVGRTIPYVVTVG